MSLEDNVRTVLRNELEASETIEDIVNNNDWEEIDRQFIETCGELVNRADDPKRKKMLLIVTLRVGEAIQSDDVIAFSKKHLEEWKEKYA